MMTALSALCLALAASGASASTRITGKRVTSRQVTPALGRGYVPSSNSYHSICIHAPDLTVPSYNYEYKFYDLSDASTQQEKMSGELSGSFAYGIVKAKVSGNYKSDRTSKTDKRYIVTRMKIQRYYSSIDESKATLSPDAKTLLDNGDYVSFFQGCGTHYIRSITRSQEVTAIFEFERTNEVESKDVAAALEAKVMSFGGVKGKFESHTDSTLDKTSMKIEIYGFGLGLSEEGSQTLVATSLEDYQEVTKFAFKTMTKKQPDIGMVDGIEVVPWVDNTMFQVAAKLNEGATSYTPPSQLETATAMCTSKDYCHSKGVKEKCLTTPGECSWDASSLDCKLPAGTVLPEKEALKCPTDSNKLTDFFPKSGDDKTLEQYCCKKPPQAENYHSGSFEHLTWRCKDGKENDSALKCCYKNELEKNTCQVPYKIPSALKRFNLIQNGEYVVDMHAVLTRKRDTLMSTKNCLSDLKSFPGSFQDFYLKTQDQEVFTAADTMSVTVGQLKDALDPDNKMTLVRALSWELNDYVEYFFTPCLHAILGTEDFGIMKTAWYDHSACRKMSCLTDNVKWDHNKKQCVESVLMHDPNELKNQGAQGDTQTPDAQGQTQTPDAQGDSTPKAKEPKSDREIKPCAEVYKSPNPGDWGARSDKEPIGTDGQPQCWVQESGITKKMANSMIEFQNSIKANAAVQKDFVKSAKYLNPKMLVDSFCPPELGGQGDGSPSSG